MNSIFDITQSQIEIFLLSMFRSAGIMATAPIFSHKTLPVQIKFAFAMILSFLIFPFAKPAVFVSPSGLLELLGVGVTEFLLGALIGFMFYLLFIGVQFAGGLIGFQVGFAIVNVIDPTTSQNISIIGQFQFLLATLLFLMMDGHHMVLSGMVDSFKLVPMATVQLHIQNANELIRMSAGAFVIAVKIASPVMLALLLTDCALGVLSRTVPQMNIFIVGFPLKIMIGLFVVGISLPIFAYIFQQSLMRLQDGLSQMIVSLAR
ncbi:MAG: flagellar biosynthetic protein FliR [Candidatus Zixiibacteriota bacterium]